VSVHESTPPAALEPALPSSWYRSGEVWAAEKEWAICEAVQQGISARVHERGYYAPMEDYNLDIRRYVLERIGDAVDLT
jgi:hypothetical protein